MQVPEKYLAICDFMQKAIKSLLGGMSFNIPRPENSLGSPDTGNWACNKPE